ncbi:helix-turn-helix domain-containing protein [Salinibacterium sp. SYSU T00001]|uniref:PucR family transcriptional regulator n=1 Tax=Homoserinimonas sedimenticola TaxID=2986805 RepID=UPI002235B444|nr:PucR family transcriptional regulator [Salinibacterium sedimenticola]MCW4385360.1 helix-turn-helix domain-containing protein [Salinibacterium sedimenticola]
MSTISSAEIFTQSTRLGLNHIAGPLAGTPITRVDVVELDALDALAEGTLAVIAATTDPAPYRIDIAIRQASARGLGGLLFTTGIRLTETAVVLATRGGMPVFTAPGVKPSELAVTIDRILVGGASESMTRSAYAIERATEAAAEAEEAPIEAILAAAGDALGHRLTVDESAPVAWSDSDAVCVGEVPIGRLVADGDDPAVAIALPVIASIVSRSIYRQMRDRQAPRQSRADLIVELVLAESSRVEGFTGQAAALGLPLQLSHVVGWIKPTHRADSTRRPPHSVEPALELFALELVDHRDEMWHVAFIRDDILIVSTEEHGAGHHQRRLREVATEIRDHARTLAGESWEYTLGLGTPQSGASGLRQSAAEARVAAESAIAAGRAGAVEVTDVTGLRRVLLDFYASPISRNLLDDVLHPLDALGRERSTTAVRTLLAYLSHRNSLAQAGRELTLHPNAVAYRLKRIREALQVDLDDPDTRFAVELACRVRLLGASRSSAPD